MRIKTICVEAGGATPPGERRISLSDGAAEVGLKPGQRLPRQKRMGRSPPAAQDISHARNCAAIRWD